MDIGLLWFDNEKKRTLAQKVTRAADHYEAKFGARPTHCYVNPCLLPDADQDDPPEFEGVVVCPSGNVLTNHFWLGVDESEPARLQSHPKTE